MTYHDVLTLHLMKSKDQDQKSPKLNHIAVIFISPKLATENNKLILTTAIFFSWADACLWLPYIK